MLSKKTTTQAGWTQKAKREATWYRNFLKFYPETLSKAERTKLLNRISRLESTTGWRIKALESIEGWQEFCAEADEECG